MVAEVIVAEVVVVEMVAVVLVVVVVLDVHPVGYPSNTSLHAEHT